MTSRLETSRYRDFSQFFESIGLGLENLGLEKKSRIGLENIWSQKKSRPRSRKFWSRKKVLVSVSMKFFGLVTQCLLPNVFVAQRLCCPASLLPNVFVAQCFVAQCPVAHRLVARRPVAHCLCCPMSCCSTYISGRTLIGLHKQMPKSGPRNIRPLKALPQIWAFLCRPIRVLSQIEL